MFEQWSRLNPMYSDKHKTEVRTALAARTGLSLHKVRNDEEALTGSYRGRDLRLYSFNKGRGGIFFRIELGLKTDADVHMLIRSGLTGGLSAQISDQTGLPADENFTKHYLVKGEPQSLAVKAMNSATLQQGLLAALKRAGGIEIRTDDGYLIYEQLDYGKHDADYLQQLIGLLNELACSIEGS